VAYAWLPGARRIRTGADGGPMGGGVPRAVWLTLGRPPGGVSVQSAAERLLSECRPCHLIWDPVTGEVAQLISVLRAGRALGAPDRLDRAPNRVTARPETVNKQGRICVQIGVLSTAAEPFTSGPMPGVEAIIGWLDAWGVARHWPCGQPGGPRACPPSQAGQAGLAGRRALWARGGHFGASQVPGCEHAGPGSIDIDRLTGPRGRQVHPWELPAPLSAAALPIPALTPRPVGYAIDRIYWCRWRS
jgi:hypothetical protein